MDVQKFYLLLHSEISDTRLYSTMKRSHGSISRSPNGVLNDFSALWFVFPLSQTQIFCNKSACLSPERARCSSSISSFLHFTGFCFSWNFSRNSLWSHCRVPETWSKHLLLLKVLTKGTSKQHNKAQEICSVLWASKIRNATRQNQTEPAKQTACSQKKWPQWTILSAFKQNLVYLTVLLLSCSEQSKWHLLYMNINN